MLFMNWAKILCFFFGSLFLLLDLGWDHLWQRKRKKDDLWSPAMKNCRGKGWMILFVALLERFSLVEKCEKDLCGFDK